MSWGEASRLIEQLAKDPSSAVAAALGGWDFPISRTTLAVLDLFDLFHQANSKRTPKPHPGRPFGRAKGKRRGTARPISEVRDRLQQRFGHAPPI